MLRASLKLFNILLCALLLFGPAGCSLPAPGPAPGYTATPELELAPPAVARTGAPVLLPDVSATPGETVTAAAPSATPDPPTATAALTPAITPTLDPYAGLSVASLSARAYGGGELQIVQVLEANSYFTRTLISYPSDGLTIYGFMNVPVRFEPPFPVVIASHGYIEPEVYQTIDYTTRYADALARAGFLVLHPNLRGYPPSDEGDNLFRVGMAVDVLNLIGLVRRHGGQSGALQPADPLRIGVWGHSMGGGVSTRVITVDPGVQAALLYGPMGADEKLNFERINTYFSPGTRGNEELVFPEDAFLAISPLYYLDRIQAQVSVHHGSADSEVPITWSRDLCRRLQALGKTVECFEYTGAPHTFFGEVDDLFMARMIEFYTRALGAARAVGAARTVRAGE